MFSALSDYLLLGDWSLSGQAVFGQKQSVATREKSSLLFNRLCADREIIEKLLI
jgi:hypothetical protein